jgi:hypothetical protein
MFKLFAVILFVTSIYSQTPRTARDFSERGLERYAKGAYDEAIVDFTQTIELTSRLEIKRKEWSSNFSTDQQSLDEAILRDRIRVIDPRCDCRL